MKVTLVRLHSVANVTQVLSRFRSEAPIYWDTIKTLKKEAFQQKVVNLRNWYTRFLRLDEVKLYQDRVVVLHEKLLEAQETRRKIGTNLAEIQKKINQLQDEIHKVKRAEDPEKCLVLMKNEAEVLTQERDMTRRFQETDRAERDLFSAFTNAVRDSYEKQRSQLEYTKYFGIILSIAGSFLAFCYTRLLGKSDMKKIIKQNIHNNNYDEVLQFLRSKTVKQELAAIERENTRPILYYVGAGVLTFVVLKVLFN